MNDNYCEDNGSPYCLGRCPNRDIIEQIRSEIDNECKKYDRTSAIRYGLSVAITIIDLHLKDDVDNEQKCDCRTCVNAGDYIVCCMYDRDIADIEGCDFYQEDVTVNET